MLNGCATRASIPLAVCERDIREKIGWTNDTATNCCFDWYLWHCFEKELLRNCNETELAEAWKFLHFDKMIQATSKCKNYPDKYTCDWHFHLLVPMWLIILFIIFVTFFCVGGIVLTRKCCTKSSSSSSSSSPNVRTNNGSPIVKEEI